MNIDTDEENKIITDNINLIRSTAMMFSPKTEHHLEELMQIGSIGMLKALRTWDGERNFSTLAVVIMRRDIMNYLRGISRHFGVIPIGMMASNLVYYPEENPTEYLPDNLTHEERTIFVMRLERYTNREIADYLELTAKQFKDILRSLSHKVKRANEAKNSIR